MAAAVQWGACAMFKLTFFLCAGIYTAMFFGGADRGQQRFGLLEKPRVMAQPVVVLDVMPTPAPVPVTPTVFTPTTPLMATPVAVETVTKPEIAAEGALKVVNSRSANLRSGPGKSYDVVGRLTRGDSVLVVTQSDEADGWTLIRLAGDLGGDGIEGYIATRLLRE